MKYFEMGKEDKIKSLKQVLKGLEEMHKLRLEENKTIREFINLLEEKRKNNELKLYDINNKISDYFIEKTKLENTEEEPKQ